jgi:hypothetical protein
MRINTAGVSNNQKTAFFDGLFAELVKVPFGAIGKRDMECLLLSLMKKHDIGTWTANRDAANALGINETRLKGYLIDMRYKFGDDEKDANVRAIIEDIFIAGHTKVLYEQEKRQFVFAVEDPVRQQDFFQAMKDKGFYSDTSFNREIVKVKDAALLAFLLDYDNDKTHAKFKALVKENSDLVSELGEIKNPGAARITFCDKFLQAAVSVAGKGITGDPIAAGVELLHQVALAIA